MIEYRWMTIRKFNQIIHENVDKCMNYTPFETIFKNILKTWQQNFAAEIPKYFKENS